MVGVGGLFSTQAPPLKWATQEIKNDKAHTMSSFCALPFVVISAVCGFTHGAAAAEFAQALADLNHAAQAITTSDAALEGKGALWTPGRIPSWSSAQ